MAIIDWEAARRRDGHGPEPAGAIPECSRSGSSPKALAAWSAMNDREKRILLNNAWCRDCREPTHRSLPATRFAPTSSESRSRANARNAAAPSSGAATRRHPSSEDKRTDFADAAEHDAYLWDKLSRTSNSCTVVYAAYSADN